jgi:hypothetical protein
MKPKNTRDAGLLHCPICDSCRNRVRPRTPRRAALRPFGLGVGIAQNNGFLRTSLNRLSLNTSFGHINSPWSGSISLF